MGSIKSPNLPLLPPEKYVQLPLKLVTEVLHAI